MYILYMYISERALFIYNLGTTYKL